MDRNFVNASGREVSIVHISLPINLATVSKYYVYFLGASSNLSGDYEDLLSDDENDEDMMYIEIGEILDKRPTTRSIGS